MELKVLGIFVVMLSPHLVYSDADLINQCPEYNPQSHVDIDLVSF